ncbi:MAG: hypothetical protein ISEC1_P0266 [Thiomicrorhabdus sp.]|nr:MAG: hypothetical protein ISEC1_P0266 [Thiomicrorhabdus sp.]
MNRRKKIIKKLTKKYKQAQAKKQPQNKQPYVSKADREETELHAERDIQAEELQTP